MKPPANWHASVTVGRVLEMVERELDTLDDPGICIVCGEEADGVEPDAKAYPCQSCGTPNVYGAEELLIMMVP